MTRAEQKGFIRSLLKNTREYVFNKSLPKGWAGVELRWYVAKYIGCVCEDRYAKRHRSRSRAYNNDLMVNPLGQKQGNG